MWTRRAALTLIRELEPKLAAQGWHCALAGGVLTRGSSRHDLDLVVYPHTTEKIDLKALQRVFEACGWNVRRDLVQTHRYWRSIGSRDRKHVEVWTDPRGRRIDVIYPVATL